MAADEDRAELLALAQRAAVSAGQLLLSRFHPADRGELDIATKSSSTDLVSEMDVAAERQIVETIRAERPHDRFVTEEGTAGPQADAAPDSITWVIDPLDGTINYLYGLPHWAVSIAAMQANTIVAGVVEIPVMREQFRAVLGGGSIGTTDGRERALSLDDISSPDLAQAMIGTGFSYTRSRRAEQARVVADLLPHVRDIRRLGAAATDLCHLAAGRVDGFYERGLNLWDVAAGGLVAVEAGACLTGVAGVNPGVADPWPGTRGDLVVAAAPPLYRDLAMALRRADA